MLKRSASTIANQASSNERYMKVRLIAQPSREARELQRQLLDKDRLLKELDDELDELMNCDSDQLQILEDERKQLFQQKTVAEIKSERLQRRVDELEAELHRLKPQKLDSTGPNRASGLSANANPAGNTESHEDPINLLAQSTHERGKRDQQMLIVPKTAVDHYVAGDTKLIPYKAKLPSYPQDALQSENAQKWFPSAFEYLNQDLGDDYNDLFKNWVKFERLKDWVSSTKGLARHNRPKELSKWILNCRYDRPELFVLVERSSIFGLATELRH
ncbi:hypothetical protein F5879DRAFT_995083 [Lentinula edodes]|nr:hypothetical protein F5879DRAFT_995083 [Lentinula edodes]